MRTFEEDAVLETVADGSGVVLDETRELFGGEIGL
jgi:hypothetical protein